MIIPYRLPSDGSMTHEPQSPGTVWTRLSACTSEQGRNILQHKESMVQTSIIWVQPGSKSPPTSPGQFDSKTPLVPAATTTLPPGGSEEILWGKSLFPEGVCTRFSWKNLGCSMCNSAQSVSF